MDTIDIEITSQSFEESNITLQLKAFNLNYNGNDYLVSTHHNIPISKVRGEKGNLNIKINSLWNEGLILEHIKDSYDLKINNMIQKKFPKENEKIVLKVNDKRHEMKTIGHHFFPFDNSPTSPMIPYITGQFNEVSSIQKENMNGLSGSPVFINNKLIGVFSKYNTMQNIAYILPIYIITMNIEKKDNSHIYDCMIQNIKKINSYNVNKNNEIYHPTLKIYIPLKTFYLLEGDINYKMLVQTESSIDEVTLHESRTLIISNEADIINEKKYKVNTRLLTLMKRLAIDISIIKVLWTKIMSIKSEVWFTIEDNKINLYS